VTRARTRASVPNPPTAVTAAGVARHLGQARSFRIMAGEFSTGGLEKSPGSEMAALMRSGASRERSVMKLTQNSKLQAVMADRLWTVHDVSAFLGVPVGTLYPVAVHAGRAACLPGGPTHPVRPRSGAYLAEHTGRQWPVTFSDALTGNGGHATATQTIASTPGTFPAA
jgi:hypothetical protein